MVTYDLRKVKQIYIGTYAVKKMILQDSIVWKKTGEKKRIMFEINNRANSSFLLLAVEEWSLDFIIKEITSLVYEGKEYISKFEVRKEGDRWMLTTEDEEVRTDFGYTTGRRKSYIELEVEVIIDVRTVVIPN